LPGVLILSTPLFKHSQAAALFYSFQCFVFHGPRPGVDYATTSGTAQNPGGTKNKNLIISLSAGKIKFKFM
jgi:hypothetical protein